MTEHPRTVQDIVQNYENRKQGLLRALTDEVEEFYQQCHPDRENLCLYGEPDGSWSVDLPAEEVPAELPEPCLGINFARDGMAKKDWLALVAVHSDAWLMAVAFYYGAKLDSNGRDQLFSMINRSSTLFEVVTGKAKSMGGPNKKVKTERGGGTKRGRPMRNEDVSVNLRGRKAELFWPDDQSWYKVEIMQVNPQQRTAKIQYDTGDFEDLELDEIIKDQQLLLLD